MTPKPVREFWTFYIFLYIQKFLSPTPFHRNPSHRNRVIWEATARAAAEGPREATARAAAEGPCVIATRSRVRPSQDFSGPLWSCSQRLVISKVQSRQIIHWINIKIKHLQILKPAKSLVLRTGIFANGFLDFPFFGSLGFCVFCLKDVA